MATLQDCSQSESRSPRLRPLLILLALTTVAKLLILLVPPADLWPSGKGMDEELWRGTSAMEFLEGPLLPLLDYQINDFSGGSLVIAALDVPLFWLFGAKLWVMRLATLPFQLLAVVSIFLLLERSHGRRAACLAGTLLALLPPGHAFVAATAWGTHMEGIALGLALTCVALRYLGQEPRRPKLAFLYGLLAGFALYFGYLALVLIATLLTYECLRDARGLLTRSTLWRLLGFACGFAPWLAYNLQHDFGGLSPYSRGVGERVQATLDLSQELRAGWHFLTTHQAGAFYLPDWGPIRGMRWSQCLYVLLAVGAALGALLSLRRRPTPSRLQDGPQAAAVALLYLPLYCLAYVFSDFRVTPPAIQDYRYAMPCYPWLIILLISALRSRRWQLPVYGLTALLALSFASGTLLRLNWTEARASWALPGHSDTVLARTIFLKYANQKEQLAAIVQGLGRRTPERQHQTLFVLGQNYKYMLRPDTRYGPRTPPRERYAETLRALHELVDAEYKPYFEVPKVGERGYRPHERERFWQDRKAGLGASTTSDG